MPADISRIDTDRTSEILTRLERLEDEHGVAVLFACESGSRPWGLASADSDYDVRFIYARSRDEYLSLWGPLSSAKDTIEFIEGDLDFAGWDLAKALRLARGSNPTLVEWLQSPIWYRGNIALVDDLIRLVLPKVSPRAIAYSHLGVAKTTWFKHILDRSPAPLKKYLYAIRPLLAIQWMELHSFATPPVSIDTLRQQVPLNEDVAAAIEHLLTRKRVGTERVHGEAHGLHAFIADEINRATGVVSRFPEREPVPQDVLDGIFRNQIAELG